jgi:uncharacterized protein (TIGR00251 family)
LARLKVKVVPGASTHTIVGWLGEVLKVRVTAAPEKGRANAAVIGLIARDLGVPGHAVNIVTGHTSSLKLLEIEGLSAKDLNGRLEAILNARHAQQQ